MAADTQIHTHPHTHTHIIEPFLAKQRGTRVHYVRILTHSYTVAEKYKRRVGANIIMAYQGKLRLVGANYGVSGQITSCRGINYGVLRQITECRGKLRRVGANHVRCVEANYVVSRQITACRGKLWRVGEITAC